MLWCKTKCRGWYIKGTCIYWSPLQTYICFLYHAVPHMYIFMQVCDCLDIWHIRGTCIYGSPLQSYMTIYIIQSPICICLCMNITEWKNGNVKGTIIGLHNRLIAIYQGWADIRIRYPYPPDIAEKRMIRYPFFHTDSKKRIVTIYSRHSIQLFTSESRENYPETHIKH